MDAHDVAGVWEKIYRFQLASHGMGAGACLAMSGIDMALWDIRGKALGRAAVQVARRHRRKPIPAYAGGVSLGYQEPRRWSRRRARASSRATRRSSCASATRRQRDLESIAAVRKAFGDELVILIDANIGYSRRGVRARDAGDGRARHRLARGALSRAGLPQLPRSETFGRTPLAAGENHYTRFEFNRVIEDGAITILQPDLSKTGGITEALRIAALASAWKLPMHPHTLHDRAQPCRDHPFPRRDRQRRLLRGRCVEINKFRDELVENPDEVDSDGNVWPLDKPGLGLEVNEEFLVEASPDRRPWIRLIS